MKRFFTISLFYVIGFTRGLYLHLPIFTLFLLEHHVTAAMIVFSAMFYSIGQFVFEVPTGYFADRFGHKTSMIIGYAIEAIGILLLMLYPTAFFVSFSYLLGGIAAAFLSGSDEALIYENAKELHVSHVKIYGGFVSAQTVGMVLASLIGGLLYSWIGISISIPLLAGTMGALLLAAVLTFLLQESRAMKTSRSQGSEYWKTVKDGFAFIRKEDLLRTVTLVSMLIITGEWFLYNVYQPLFTEVSVPPIWFGLVISLGMVINAIVMSQIWRVEKIMKLEHLLFSSSVILVIGYFLLALIPSVVPAIVGVVIVLSFAEVYRPVLSDYLNDRIPTDTRATILSSISFSQRIISTLLRLILTGAVVLWGFRASVFVQGAYLLVGSFVSYWLLTHCGCTHRIHSKAETLLPETR